MRFILELCNLWRWQLVPTLTVCSSTPLSSPIFPAERKWLLFTRPTSWSWSMVFSWSVRVTLPKNSHSSSTKRWLWITALCSWSKTLPNSMWWLLPIFTEALFPTSQQASLAVSAWLPVHALVKTMLFSHRECHTLDLPLPGKTRLTLHQFLSALWWCWDIWDSQGLPIRSHLQSTKFWRKERLEQEILEEQAALQSSQRQSSIIFDPSTYFNDLLIIIIFFLSCLDWEISFF